jgi:hypothetical protein
MVSLIPLPHILARTNAVRIVDPETKVTIMMAADPEALRLAVVEAMSRVRQRRKRLREEAAPLPPEVR